jgi:hypothetical protein
MPNIQGLEITLEILLLISEIDEFKGTWRSLNTLAPDRLAELRKIATIEMKAQSFAIANCNRYDRLGTG